MLKPGHTWDYKERGIWIGANHALKQETIYSTFLPADGYMCDNREELYNQGSTGYYWSSTFLGVNAFYLNLDSDYVNPANICSRREGFSVRCVWVGK
ncbi:MAG: fibrobacter succinogenes major paralogous domain-containing protein [Dysgonamonadaceae bacterium]|nr:fibrobacter succinogenes major paralogous domain-containing protein [Dysgonamonadaceae bacterium]